MSNQYFAFISYASRRGEWVARLQRNLERCLDHYARVSGRSFSKRIFLDQKDLLAGQSWLKQLQDALDASERLILVISPEMEKSRWVQKEWQGFLTAPDAKSIFPVVIEHADVPAFLRPIQRIDFSGLEGDAYLERLTQLFGDLSGRSRRDPPPMPGNLELFSKPKPSYSDDDSKRISQALDLAYQQRAQRQAKGDDVTDLNITIVELKRQLRSGPQLQAGDFLLDGRFELLEAIGQGGFAMVWRAYDRKGQTVVAVKVLHSQYTEDLGRRNRFFRGARQMASLSHPRIVRVVEPECEDDGYVFFVMEYVGGGDFRQAVLEGRLTVDERLRVVLEVGEALAHAHRQGIIHRDVKPANILLDLDGGLKLTDFDLVRAADTTGGTRTVMMGTFLYAAPEAMADGKEASIPADVYSLGMTAVFALYGQELPSDVLWELPELIHAIEMPTACRPVLLRATCRQAEERWASVERFSGALREGLEGKDGSIPSQPQEVRTESWRDPYVSDSYEGTLEVRPRQVSRGTLWLALVAGVSLIPLGIQIAMELWMGGGWTVKIPWPISSFEQEIQDLEGQVEAQGMQLQTWQSPVIGMESSEVLMSENVRGAVHLEVLEGHKFHRIVLIPSKVHDYPQFQILGLSGAKFLFASESLEPGIEFSMLLPVQLLESGPVELQLLGIRESEQVTLERALVLKAAKVP